MDPSKEQAFQFAMMLQAGLPAGEAIMYFFPSIDDPQTLFELQTKWARSPYVKKASIELMGKAWQDLTLEERIEKGLNRHYAQLAYYLFSTHYAEVGVQDKAKLDSARQALEAKKAGTAGKSDAMSRFFDDIKEGKLILGGLARKSN